MVAIQRYPYRWTDLDKVDYFLEFDKYSNANRNKFCVSRVLDHDFPYSMHHVTFLIPAYNEEQSIGTLLEKIKQYKKPKVLVVDNNSQDRTAEIAKKAGARILKEEKQGKGHAIRTGFENISSEFVIMLDADNTYDPGEAKKLLEPLMKDEADVVMGCRLNKNMEEGSVSKFNYIGNRILSMCASILFSRVNDVCTGYWAFKKEVIDYLLGEGIESQGFDLEVEMFSKVASAGYRIKELPIHYKNRADEPKLSPVTDGALILRRMLLYYLKRIGEGVPRRYNENSHYRLSRNPRTVRRI